MGCQKKISEAIVEKKADYIFSLKGNQSNLHDDIKLYFQEQLSQRFSGSTYNYYETTDGEHGKIEIRHYWTTSDISCLQGKENWKNFKTICKVERERDFGEKIEKETSYYIGSVESDAQKFGSYKSPGQLISKCGYPAVYFS